MVRYNSRLTNSAREFSMLDPVAHPPSYTQLFAERSLVSHPITTALDQHHAFLEAHGDKIERFLDTLSAKNGAADLLQMWLRESLLKGLSEEELRQRFDWDKLSKTHEQTAAHALPAILTLINSPWPNGLNMRFARAENIPLSGANLGSADFTGAYLRDAIMDRVNLSNARLDYAFLETAELPHAQMVNTQLTYSQLRHANLSASDLHCANFRGANLLGAIFVGAKLEGTGFEASNLSEADFTNAELTSVDFTGARLYKADFRNADLTNVIQLSKEQMQETVWDKSTKLPPHLAHLAAPASDAQP